MKDVQKAGRRADDLTRAAASVSLRDNARVEQLVEQGEHAGVNGKIEKPLIGPQQSAGERSEPERSGGPMSGAPPLEVPRIETTEVTEKAKRRLFTAEYKKRIIEQADRALASGERGAVGALLRREGLYSSHLSEWREARAQGALAGLTPKKRGPAKRETDERDRRIAELERELAKDRVRLQQAEIIIEVQKKVSSILGIKLPETEKIS